jgi:hypothetical protein
MNGAVDKEFDVIPDGANPKHPSRTAKTEPEQDCHTHGGDPSKERPIIARSRRHNQTETPPSDG